LTTARGAGRLILQDPGSLIVSFFGELGNALKSTRSIMPEFQPVASEHVSAIERPRCPKCHQNRMLLAKLETAGSDYRTFECQKCGRIHRVVVSNDPLTSDLVGWLAGELRPPT
jgi:tRNA(Ile2) C34 agmatinyltransferase TiaS